MKTKHKSKGAQARVPVPHEPGLSISDKLAAARLEREELELIKLRAEIAQLNANAEASRMTAAQQEAIIKEEQRKTAEKIEQCSHHKGGMDMPGFTKGDSPFYSVIKHTYPLPFLKDFPHCTGTVIKCQRCPLEIHQDDPRFAEAINWPTNNRPSGNHLFTVSYTQPLANA